MTGHLKASRSPSHHLCPAPDNANNDALQTLMNGTADAVWLYADQVKNYQCGEGTVASHSRKRRCIDRVMTDPVGPLLNINPSKKASGLAWLRIYKIYMLYGAHEEVICF